MNRSWSDALGLVLDEAIAPDAEEVDRLGRFPAGSIRALGEVGLLGLVSDEEAGGLGQGIDAACEVVGRLAERCASTAMIVCMHYAATAVVEAHGPQEVRVGIAKGDHLSTLAFSEAGSRSHFWAPVGTAATVNGSVRLDAQKSWVTAATAADSYVWSSRPASSSGVSTLWLVPAATQGLEVVGPFEGLGLRGNDSSPVRAADAHVAPETRLGDDGAGFDIMMNVVLPWFTLMNAAFSVGIMRATTAKTVDHAGAVRFEHLGDRLADLPTIRAYLARMRIRTDQAESLLADAIDAVMTGRGDAQLRVLESKASAGEAATEVTELGMRVCGGAAFRKGLGLERHMRDARASTVMAPTTDALYDFIGKAMCGLPLFSDDEEAT
jgi:alkylation response protein AidB-like acyl-CoA dehydrogenase